MVFILDESTHSKDKSIVPYEDCLWAEEITFSFPETAEEPPNILEMENGAKQISSKRDRLDADASKEEISSRKEDASKKNIVNKNALT